MKKIKVLHMVKTVNMGGIETFLVNLLKKLDQNKYQFDFLLWTDEKCYYEDEIKELGGKIYRIKITNNPIKDILTVKKFLDKHNYDVVHSHSLFYSGFFMLAAKIAKVKIRISHMHSKSDNEKNTFIRKLYKSVARFLMKNLSTSCCACSEEAAIYGFSKINNKVIIINNCINVDNFINVDTKKVDNLKKKLSVNNNIVIGNIARLTIEKNQKYILDIVEDIVKNKKYKKIKCLFIGDGEERERLEKITKEKQLEKNIIFIGQASNVNEYLKIMDIFIFPSLYEGFGMALLEAQAAGTYSLASDTIPRNTDMGIGIVEYLSISNNNIDEWSNKIINYKKQMIDNKLIKKKINEKGFDINATLEQLIKIYENK